MQRPTKRVSCVLSSLLLLLLLHAASNKISTASELCCRAAVHAAHLKPKSVSLGWCFPFAGFISVGHSLIICVARKESRRKVREGGAREQGAATITHPKKKCLELVKLCRHWRQLRGMLQNARWGQQPARLQQPASRQRQQLQQQLQLQLYRRTSWGSISPNLQECEEVENNLSSLTVKNAWNSTWQGRSRPLSSSGRQPGQAGQPAPALNNFVDVACCRRGQSVA